MCQWYWRSQLLEIAHRLDAGDSLDLTRDKKAGSDSLIIDLTQANRAEELSTSIDATQDKKAEGNGESFELKQDKNTDLERIKAEGAQAVALQKNAITPRAKGGSYAANNATGIKRLVDLALALLAAE